MGEVCARMADLCILTEDNNRFEKVEDIIADIKTGMQKGNPNAKYVEIHDRLDAIHYAMDHAQEGDLIALIGKGHESYRDREGVKTPFLERELIEEYAAKQALNNQKNTGIHIIRPRHGISFARTGVVFWAKGTQNSR